MTVAALILSYGPTASYAQQSVVYDPGNHSCGKYLAAVHGHAPGKGNGYRSSSAGTIFMMTTLCYMAWLDGFFTATNLWVTE